MAPILATAYLRGMFYVELIRHMDGRLTSEGLPPIEPDLGTLGEAIEAGHRVYGSRGPDTEANGFRIKARGSEVVHHVWTEDMA